MIGKREATDLDILDAHGHLLVRRAAERDDEVAEALFNVAARTGAYTTSQWDAVLAKLDRSKLKVSTWLARRSDPEPDDYSFLE